MSPPRIRLPWYRDGLRFTCTQCGNCCTGEGYVWLSRGDAVRLADGMNMEVGEFLLRYGRIAQGAIALLDKGPHHDCVFLGEDRRCTVYESRPQQCRSWPFWPSNLTSSRAWKEVQTRCPGAGKGELHTLEEIQGISGGHKRGRL